MDFYLKHNDKPLWVVDSLYWYDVDMWGNVSYTDGSGCCDKIAQEYIQTTSTAVLRINHLMVYP